MAEPVTIPISVFELTADYLYPDLVGWADRGRGVQALFESLKPWNLSVDDIELRTVGKFSEQGVNFKVPMKRASFFFGTASCTFSQEGVDLSSAEETLAM